MKNLYILIGAILLAAIVVVLLLPSLREGFANAIRTQVRCSGGGADTPLHTTQLMLRGFNYSRFPSWYEHGVLVIPYQFDWDSFNTVYKYSIYSGDFADGCLVLETSEDIEPIVDVYDENTEQLYQIKAVRMDDSEPGYIRWNICLDNRV